MTRVVRIRSTDDGVRPAGGQKLQQEAPARAPGFATSPAKLKTRAVRA